MNEKAELVFLHNLFRLKENLQLSGLLREVTEIKRLLWHTNALLSELPKALRESQGWRDTESAGGDQTQRDKSTRPSPNSPALLAAAKAALVELESLWQGNPPMAYEMEHGGCSESQTINALRAAIAETEGAQ